MLAQLIPESGAQPITLDTAITVLGRSSRLCDLVLDDTSISKQHCMLVKTDGLVYIRDLGSTNGTRVNGQRVIRGALLPGDQLAFGALGFQVHFGPDHGPRATQTATSRGRNEQQTSQSDVRLLRDSDLLLPD